MKPAVCPVEALTAVWAVMWVQPTILAPASGFSLWALFLREIKADMSEMRVQAVVREGSVISEGENKFITQTKDENYRFIHSSKLTDLTD